MNLGKSTASLAFIAMILTFAVASPIEQHSLRRSADSDTAAAAPVIADIDAAEEAAPAPVQQAATPGIPVDHQPQPAAPQELPQLPQLPQQLSPPPPRRVVSYDQRQEGKYNVRADLENFMIVVIPSSPSAGGAASLLDLLTRSKQPQLQQLPKSAVKVQKKEGGAHKKYHAPGSKLSPESLAPRGVLAAKPALVLQPSERPAGQPQPFIEGRTPYRVDISGTGTLQQQPSHIYAPRSSKSLQSGVGQPLAELSHNSVVLIGHLSPAGSHHQQRGFAWGSVFDKERPELFELRGDVDADEDEPLVSDEDSNDSVDRLAAAETPKSGGSVDGGAGGWDQLTLLGADEQCGPDRRRDSYGICQFVAID